MTESKGIKELMEAVNFVEEKNPLTRCEHGNALKDHGNNKLYPSCGCRIVMMNNNAPRPSGGA